MLPRLMGEKRAKELIFTGRMMSADEALGLGIVNQSRSAGRAAGRRPSSWSAIF